MTVEFERKKPFGITVAMVFLGFLGGLGSFAGLFGLASALFGDGPFRMNGDLVSKAEFLRFAIPFYAFYISACLVAGSAAWSIHVQHPRSRPLLLAYAFVFLLLTPLFLVLGVPAEEVFPSALFTIVVPVLVWFYLYRKSSVVQYYDAIRIDGAAASKGE